MTEDEWLGGVHVRPLLEFVAGRTSERKLRRVGCACARRLLGVLRDARLAALVDAGERAADGADVTGEVGPLLASLNGEQQGWTDLEQNGVTGVVFAAVHPPTMAHYPAGITWLASAAGYAAAPDAITDPDDWSGPSDPVWRAASAGESAAQACIVREVVGNPFREPMFDPAWRTSTVVGLAQAIYAGRAFDRLPVLADALEEAGCDNNVMLAHCREPGVHCRGCWVVDLVLGKS